MSQIVEELKLEDEPVSTFASLGVCKELCDACENLKYKIPTKIQQESIPHSLKGNDIIALAETGSGKTLAFAIPIIQRLMDNPQTFFALILSPTRELSIQIYDHFNALGTSIGLKSIVIVGGMDPLKQTMALAKSPHIIIGTPGRVLYHLENTKGFSLGSLKYLVFDEADKLLNMDFEKEINKILSNIPKERNTMLFSATMTNKVSKLQRASLSNPVKIEVSSKFQTVVTLSQYYLFVPSKYKDCYLTYILNENSGKSVFIFINTCLTVLRITLMLRNMGFSAIGIHGKLGQSKRLGALNKFKAGERKILIATDVASRGLDIPGVDLVINYDLPTHSKEYVHRVGRTARAGKAGKSITLVTQYDVEEFQKIEHAIEKQMELYKTVEEEVLIFFERVQEAERLAKHEMKNADLKAMADDNDEQFKKELKISKSKKIGKNPKKFDKKKRF